MWFAFFWEAERSVGLLPGEEELLWEVEGRGETELCAGDARERLMGMEEPVAASKDPRLLGSIGALGEREPRMETRGGDGIDGLREWPTENAKGTEEEEEEAVLGGLPG